MKSEMMIGTFMICGVFAGCAHKPKAPARTENKTPTQAQRVQAFVALDEQGCPDEGERRDWTPIGVTAYRKELAAEKTKHVKQMFALSDDESRLFNPSAPHHVHELDDQTMALWTCAHPELFSRERTAIADASMDNYQQASIVAKDTCLADLAGKVLGIRINRGGTSDPTNPNAALRAIDVIKTTMDGMGCGLTTACRLFPRRRTDRSRCVSAARWSRGRGRSSSRAPTL